MFVFLMFLAFGDDMSFRQVALHLCPCILFAHKLNRNKCYNLTFIFVYLAINIPLFFHLDKYENYRRLEWYYEFIIVLALSSASFFIYYLMHNLL